MVASGQREDLTDNDSLRDLREPVAVFLSYTDKYKFEQYMSGERDISEINNLTQEMLIKKLRKLGYPAVSDDDPRAANPRTVVVTKSGIQMPFMEPEVAKMFAKDLVEDVKATGIALPMSLALGVRVNQLSVPKLAEASPDNNLAKLVDHPDGRVLDEIEKRRGPNFLHEMFKEAWEKSKSLPSDSPYPFGDEKLKGCMFSGRKTASYPWTVWAKNNLESRSLVYMSDNWKTAVRYTKGQGFVHCYDSFPEQEKMDDLGIEKGKEKQNGNRQFEAILVAEKNGYAGSYILMQDKYFEIPVEDERWKDFIECMRPTGKPSTPYMAERTINILKEAKKNHGRAQTFVPAGVNIEEVEIPQKNVDVKLEDVCVPQNDLSLAKLRKNFNNCMNTIKDFIDTIRKETRKKLPPYISHNLVKNN